MKRGLYAVVDVDACAARRLEPRAVAEGALEGGAVAVQLRAKRLGVRATLALAEELAALTRVYGASFFVNDRLDIALAVGAGVHVGQGDLPPAAVRRASPSVAFGVSTHTREELETARAASPTYVALGPIFATASKENPEPVVGLAALSEMSTVAATVPLVAIGGISSERAALVYEAGASLVAVIAGILPSAGEAVGDSATISAVAARARAYHPSARLS